MDGLDKIAASLRSIRKKALFESCRSHEQPTTRRDKSLADGRLRHVPQGRGRCLK